MTAQSTCPVAASFTPFDTAVSQSKTINFKNQSTGATSYKWYINNQLVGSAKDLTYSFANVGAYIIKLVALNGTCSVEKISTVVASQQCYQPSFQKIFRSPNNESIAQVYNMPDESMILVGSVIRAGRNDKDALMMKLDRRGKILWAKAIGGNNDDELTKVIFCDDKLITIGNTKSFGDPLGRAWALGVSHFGDINWSQMYFDNIAAGLLFTDITNVGNTVTISGVYQQNATSTDALAVSLAGYDGHVLLHKRLNNNSTDQAHAIHFVWDTLCIVSTRKLGGLNSLIVTAMSQNGEKNYYSNRINIANTNTQPQSILKNNDSYLISSTITNPAGANAKPLWIKLWNDATFISTLNIEHGGPITNVAAHTLANGALWNASTQGNKLTVSAYDTAVGTHASFTYASDISVKGIGVNTDSSINIICDIETNGSNDILIDKITTKGENFGCTPADADVTANLIGASISNGGWKSITDFECSTAPTTGLVIEDLNFTIESLCEAPVCQAYEPEGCTPETFFKVYADDNNRGMITEPLVRENDILAIGGITIGMGGGITSFNFNGAINYIKKYGDSRVAPSLTSLLLDGDNNVVVGGVDPTAGAGFSEFPLLLMKTNPTGDIIWQRNYTLQAGYPSKLVQCSDGNYLFAMLIDRFRFSQNNTLVIMKVNKNDGAIMWSKEFTTGVAAVSISNIQSKDGTIFFLAGSAGGPYPQIQSYVFAFDDMTGNPIAARRFYDNNIQYQTGKIQTLGSGYLISGHYVNEKDDYNFGFYVAVLDKDFNLVRSRFINIDNANSEIQLVKNSDNDFVVYNSSFHYFYGGYLPQLFKLDSLLNIVWVRKNNPRVKENLFHKGFARLPDSSYVSVGGKMYSANIESNFTNGFLAKFTKDGTLLGCPSEPVNITYPSYQLKFANFTLTENEKPVIQTSASNFTASTSPNITVQSVKCNTPSACTFLKINGATSICNYKDTAVFKVIRNTNCLGAVQWHNDSSYTNIISYSDSSISIIFKKPGSTKLFASIDGGCVGLIQDSIEMTASSSTLTLNLGNDTTLCAGTILKLRATKEFQTFKWQDGSTDSTFTVTTAGKYNVTATDYCDGIFSDTIIINVVDAAAITLPSAIAHCINDTLQLSADAGFETYTWKPNYFIEGRFTKDVKIFALKDTSYILKVTTSTGCTLNDTLKVNVIHTDKINLGNDTSLCNNQSLTLNIPASYTNILWSTGSNSSSIMVAAAGYYSVLANDKNTCKVYDTLQVVKVFETPVFNLGSDTSICNNQLLTLSAPSGFDYYTWSNGSDSNSIVASVAGLYWLTAKNGACAYSDSITVLNVFSAQRINLGSDTSFCNNQSVTLTIPPSFSNVMWSTGSTAHNITAATAGYYSVKANDNNGCAATDTLRIVAVFDVPVFNLGNDTSICFNKPLTLLAPAGFTNYTWSNGSNAPSIVVSEPGGYSLTIKNGINECANSDTVRILNVFKTIENILEPTALICPYETYVIKARGIFNQYLWSTKELTPSITIFRGGIYSLTVTDQNNCKSTDSIIVSEKDCEPKIFFPTAFTPNKDGKNDVYKSIATQLLEVFKIEIYNRFGQKVFESGNINMGWDGNINGTAQPSGYFVWKATYKFYNELKKEEKGSFVLMR